MPAAAGGGEGEGEGEGVEWEEGGGAASQAEGVVTGEGGETVLLGGETLLVVRGTPRDEDDEG